MFRKLKSAGFGAGGPRGRSPPGKQSLYKYIFQNKIAQQMQHWWIKKIIRNIWIKTKHFMPMHSEWNITADLDFFYVDIIIAYIWTQV